jgi:hypothetical protein
MSRALSSKRRGAPAGLTTLSLAALLLASGCTHGGESAGTSGSSAGSRTVGYVDMDDLVKRHPLYGELSRLDDDVAALQLRSVGGQTALSPGELERERRALQKELDAATNRARAALKAKQDEYGKQEAEAIRQALAAAGTPANAGVPIANGMQLQLQAQAKSVSADAQRNLDTYRRDLLNQDNAALRALQRSLNERAARTYRAQAEVLQRKEADYALSLAGEDSTLRLSLRAKLTNLVLEDSNREDARKQLDALDKKEADDLAAMKNRDAATLATLQTQLRTQTTRDLDAQASAMRKRTLAKINSRELDTRKAVVAKINGLAPVANAGGNVSVPAGLPPDMRAKLEALHKQYQDDFNRDAKQTLGDFEKTKITLAERFARLQGIDTGAEGGAGKQLNVLQRQRSDLYEQMVAQIGREVKLIAAKRGIDVVLSDVVAPAGGVDLTPDAEKDIESLHE